MNENKWISVFFSFWLWKHFHFQILQKKGFNKLILQIGNSDYEKIPKFDDFEIEIYRFKESIAEDISSASLIICHAGNWILVVL